MNWAYVPAGLLLAMLAGLLSLARIAKDDPGFAVEPDYYRKATQWDAEMAQRAENERLGWQTELAVATLPSGRLALTLRLRDRAGAPIEHARVALEAFHNARAATPLELTLEPGPTGYVAEIPPQRPGLWEFRLSAQAGSERFTTVYRRQIEAPR
jgi:nitrogen fixation protein FixH